MELQAGLVRQRSSRFPAVVTSPSIRNAIIAQFEAWQLHNTSNKAFFEACGPESGRLAELAPAQREINPHPYTYGPEGFRTGNDNRDSWGFQAGNQRCPKDPNKAMIGFLKRFKILGAF